MREFAGFAPGRRALQSLVQRARSLHHVDKTMGSFDQSNSSQLLEKLKRNEPVVAMMIRGSRTADVAPSAASTGYQSIIVDLEHSTMALDVVAEMVTSANDYGVLPFVRVPERDYESVGRILDAGACGIVLLGSKRR